MKYVGFPDGLGMTVDAMPGWHEWITEGRPAREHFSIYDDGMYCGECFYDIDSDHDNLATVDIKLLPEAQGKGAGTAGLTHAIRAAFDLGATRARVDPNPDSTKALALYERLGFVRVAVPEHIQQDWAENNIKFPPAYMEISKDQFDAQRK